MMQSMTEYPIRVHPKKKKYNLMVFHEEDVRFTHWKKPKMRCKVAPSSTAYDASDMPEFGAGSVYKYAEKMAAKRNRYGRGNIQKKQVNRAWALDIDGKKFEGQCSGTAEDRSCVYYLMFLQADGKIDAHPVDERYAFKPAHRFKALNDEEAEKQFARRDKTLNHHEIMVHNRLKQAASEEEGEQNEKKQMNLERVEYMDSDDDDDGSENDENVSGNKKKQKKKNFGYKKKKIGASDDDDDDHESRERECSDYSSESDSEPEDKPIVESDEESEEEEEKKTENDEEDSSSSMSESDSESKKKTVKGSLKRKADTVLEKPVTKVQVLANKTVISGPSKAADPRSMIREEHRDIMEAVERYLKRKPITTSDLIQKFKKLKLNGKVLTDILTKILKVLGPKQSTIDGKVHWSLP